MLQDDVKEEREEGRKEGRKREEKREERERERERGSRGRPRERKKPEKKYFFLFLFSNKKPSTCVIFLPDCLFVSFSCASRARFDASSFSKALDEDEVERERERKMIRQY